jgi:hypothetical protein
LQHVMPEHVDRMAAEHWQHGIDGVMWLGYGERSTFPSTVPASWERAGALHRRLRAGLPPRPAVDLAVLRGYGPRALCSYRGDQVRNPADWLLQQWLEVWAVEENRPYDVFELPPALSGAERDALVAALAPYRYIVSTVPWPGAWVLGDGAECTELPQSDAARTRSRLRTEIVARGW